MLSEEFKEEVIKRRNKLLQCFRKDNRFRIKIKDGVINIIYNNVPVFTMSEITKDSTDEDYILIYTPRRLTKEEGKKTNKFYELVKNSIENINIEDYPRIIFEIFR